MVKRKKPGELTNVLFPSSPRDFPFRRTVRILLRTLHIFSTGVLLGGYIFSQPVAVLEVWLWWAVISGLLLLATDLHASMAILFEVRGLAVLIKVILVFLVPVIPQVDLQLLVAALIVGAVSSHLPKNVRHKTVLLRSRLITDERSG